MNRRALMTSAAALPVAMTATPSSAGNGVHPQDDGERVDPSDRWRKLVEVVEDLENPEEWEMAAVVWAKAHAAGEIRKALGMDLPECPSRAEYDGLTNMFRQRFAETRNGGSV